MSSTDNQSGAFSRRQMLRWTGMATLAVPTVGMLSSCALSDGPAKAAPKGKVTAKNPLGVAGNGTLDVVIFKGGFSDEYATKVHEPLFKRAFPNASVKHTATQKVAQTLQPRLVGGNPPDVASVGDLDTNAMIQDGQMLDLTPLLDAPSVDDPKVKVRDTLLAGTVEDGTVEGKVYRLLYNQGVQGIWYDAKLFEKKGWQPPSTWGDFLTLCAKIKKAGLDPFGYSGKAADYCGTLLLTSMAKTGGPDAMRAIDNLEDGAWQADAVKQVLTAYAEFGAKYLPKKYEGLTNLEAQLRQVQGKLAFYPSGNWLENEMKKDTPSGFEFAMMPTPSVTGSDKLDASALRVSPSGDYFVPAKAKNPTAGLEYLRQMLSKAGAAGFTELTGTLTSVKGAADGVSLPPGAQSSAKSVSAASEVFTYKLLAWYVPLADELKDATNALMFGRITPEKFIERMQKKSDEVKKDPAIKKFTR